MEKENPQILKRNVSVVLDEILARHMERLLGSRFGIDGLPMNLRTLACITLLTDVMGLSETSPSASEKAHTLESLRTELGDLGLGADEDLQPLLEDLTRRGYALAVEQGFLPGKPALTMAQVMGRIFPKMMGAGFLAYLVQTIDEVSTGRKELEAAATQFDQTLKMQGAPLKRRSEPPPPKKVSEAPTPPGTIREKSPPRGPHTPAPTALSGQREQGRVRVLGSSVDSLVFETRGAETLIPPSAQPSPSADVRQEEEPPEALETQDTETDSPPADERQEEPLGASSDAAPEAPPQTEETAGLEAPSPTVEPSSYTPPPSDPETAAAPDDPYEPLPECTVTEEDSLEKDISRFEEELAAQCPLCKTSTVRQRQTPAGRAYYQCGNRECSFVSWGRPYHLPCPRCQNPFMVEVPESGERRLLRCPRATCRYTRTLSSPSGIEAVRGPYSGQGLPQAGDGRVEGARRRVVRRRVVRKKK